MSFYWVFYCLSCWSGVNTCNVLHQLWRIQCFVDRCRHSMHSVFQQENRGKCLVFCHTHEILIIQASNTFFSFCLKKPQSLFACEKTLTCPCSHHIYVLCFQLHFYCKFYVVLPKLFNIILHFLNKKWAKTNIYHVKSDV